MIKYKLDKENISKGCLILVNPNHLFKRREVELVKFSEEFREIELNEECRNNLVLALEKINAEEEIVPVSGYRTRESQQKIWNDSLEENGLSYTKKYVAVVDASEHQTGLAIDLAEYNEKIDFIAPSFPRYGICQEFRKVASDFGFIERYTTTHEDTTMISAEEWHFRYVSYPHSKIIQDMDFCLEEYIEYLKDFMYPSKPLVYDDYEIFYIPYTSNDAYIKLNDKCTISGNNVDGFILTRRKL